MCLLACKWEKCLKLYATELFSKLKAKTKKKNTSVYKVLLSFSFEIKIHILSYKKALCRVYSKDTIPNVK